MKHFAADGAKWVEGRGYSKRVLLPENELGIPGSFLQEVRFRKGDKVPLHHHKVQTEIFYAKDEALFQINGEKVVLSPGDVLICEPGDVHGNPDIPHDFTILVLKIDYVDDDIIWD